DFATSRAGTRERLDSRGCRDYVVYPIARIIRPANRRSQKSAPSPSQPIFRSGGSAEIRLAMEPFLIGIPACGWSYASLTAYQMIADTPDRFWRLRYDGFPLAVTPTT